ncbi:hypothetical protein DNTS_009641, partial [Danionella cerebrum]
RGDRDKEREKERERERERERDNPQCPITDTVSTRSFTEGQRDTGRERESMTCTLSNPPADDGDTTVGIDTDTASLSITLKPVSLPRAKTSLPGHTTSAAVPLHVTLRTKEKDRGEKIVLDAAGQESASDAAGQESASDAAGQESASDAAGQESVSDAAGQESASDAAGQESDAAGHAMRGRRLLQAMRGRRLLQAMRGRRMLQAMRGRRMLQAMRGRRMLQAMRAHPMLQAKRAMLQAMRARRMLQVMRGRRMLQVMRGRRMLQVMRGRRMLQAMRGRRMLQAKRARRMLQAMRARRMLQAMRARRMLQVMRSHGLQHPTAWPARHVSASDAAGHASASDAAGHAMASEAAGHGMASEAAGHGMASDAAGNASALDATGQESASDAAGQESGRMLQAKRARWMLQAKRARRMLQAKRARRMLIHRGASHSAARPAITLLGRVPPLHLGTLERAHRFFMIEKRRKSLPGLRGEVVDLGQVLYRGAFVRVRRIISSLEPSGIRSNGLTSYLLWVENPDDLRDTSLVQCWDYITAGRQELQLELIEGIPEEKKTLLAIYICINLPLQIDKKLTRCNIIKEGLRSTTSFPPRSTNKSFAFGIEFKAESQKRLPYFSAARKIPDAQSALNSGSQESKKYSSSFIMPRMLLPLTRAKLSSIAPNNTLTVIFLAKQVFCGWKEHLHQFWDFADNVYSTKCCLRRYVLSSSLNDDLIAAHSFWIISRSSACVRAVRIVRISSRSLIGAGIVYFKSGKAWEESRSSIDERQEVESTKGLKQSVEKTVDDTLAKRLNKLFR